MDFLDVNKGSRLGLYIFICIHSVLLRASENILQEKHVLHLSNYVIHLFESHYCWPCFDIYFSKKTHCIKHTNLKHTIVKTSVHVLLAHTITNYVEHKIHLTSPVDWREIFRKQSVGKCKQINF